MDHAMTSSQSSSGVPLHTRAAIAFAEFREGQTGSMSGLVDLLTPMLWHVARAQGADASTAEDAVQTTWLKLVESASTIKEPQAVLQWMIVTTKRETWRIVRQGRRVQPEDVMPEQNLGEVSDPETQVLLTEQQQTLWAHVRELSQRCRELLRVIAFAERPDYAAIAEALGMPVGSIGPTRGRCLTKLRAALAADSRWVGSA